jgi:hypothetical protein
MENENQPTETMHAAKITTHYLYVSVDETGQIQLTRTTETKTRNVPSDAAALALAGSEISRIMADRVEAAITTVIQAAKEEAAQ